MTSFNIAHAREAYQSDNTFENFDTYRDCFVVSLLAMIEVENFPRISE